MKRNLDAFERVIRLLLGAFALFAAVALFTHPLARLAAGAFGLLSLAECAMGFCLLHARLGMLAPGDRLSPGMLRLFGLAAAQFVLAYTWWTAGWEKVSGRAFVASITPALEAFASQNPFPWYRAFLEGFAMRYATGFAYAIEWMQVIIGITLAASAAYFLYRPQGGAWTRRWLRCACWCLFAGAVMNANFYFAAGWTGPGTRSVNVVMFWMQGILLYVWISALRAWKADKAAAS